MTKVPRPASKPPVAPKRPKPRFTVPFKDKTEPVKYRPKSQPRK